MKKFLLGRDELRFDGGLIVIKGTKNCLGDLMYFRENKGCWCPSNGKVPVTEEEASAHNKALDQARLDGMDHCCEVGQTGSAYINRKEHRVTFFSGTVIAEGAWVSSARRAGAAGYYNFITFERAGKKYKGRAYNGSELFTFKRIS